MVVVASKGICSIRDDVRKGERDILASHDADRKDPIPDEQDDREDNAPGKDPLCYAVGDECLLRDAGLVALEHEETNCGVHIQAQTDKGPYSRKPDIEMAYSATDGVRMKFAHLQVVEPVVGLLLTLPIAAIAATHERQQGLGYLCTML